MKNYIKASLLFIAFLPISAFSQDIHDNCNARLGARISASTNPPAKVPNSTGVSRKSDPVNKSSGSIRKGIR